MLRSEPDEELIGWAPVVKARRKGFVFTALEATLSRETVPMSNTGGIVKHTKVNERRFLKELCKMTSYVRKKRSLVFPWRQGIEAKPQGIGGCDCLPTTQVYAKSQDVVCGLTPAKYLSQEEGGDMPPTECQANGRGNLDRAKVA